MSKKKQQKQLDPVSAARKKIPPQKYSRQLKCLELGNIVLKDIIANLKTYDLTGRKTFHFNEKTELVLLDENGKRCAQLSMGEEGSGLVFAYKIGKRRVELGVDEEVGPILVLHEENGKRCAQLSMGE